MQNKKLKIIYHFRVRGIGAEGVHIAGVVNGFRSLGHKVVLVSPSNIDPTKPPATTKSSTEKVNLRTKLLHKMADLLPQPLFELLEVAYNINGIVCLIKTIEQLGGADLIYERYAFFNLSGAFVSKIKKIPLVIEVNELSGLKRVRGQHFVKCCSFMEKRILRKAQLVVVVSDFLNSEVRKRIHPKKVKVITVPNGVPENWKKKMVSPETISNLRKKYNLEGKKVVCFVGGLVEWHNFRLLLEAFKRVVNTDESSLLMFVGEGPMREYILQKAKELDVSQNLLFIGNVPHEEIPVYLELSDVLVIPEVNEFRSPIKLFEYMAAGKPVVAPQKPAIESVIKEGINGMMFESRNVSSFARALIEVIRNRADAQKIGQNAKMTVFSNYTWEKHSKLILNEFYRI